MDDLIEHLNAEAAYFESFIHQQGPYVEGYRVDESKHTAELLRRSAAEIQRFRDERDPVKIRAEIKAQTEENMKEGEKALAWLQAQYPDGVYDLHVSTDPESGGESVWLEARLESLDYDQTREIEYAALFVPREGGGEDYRSDLPFDPRAVHISIMGGRSTPRQIEEKRKRDEEFDAEFSPEEQAVISRWLSFSWGERRKK